MRMIQFLLVPSTVVCLVTASLQLTFAQGEIVVPTFEEVISLSSPSNPQISPDGEHVLFQVRKADWEANKFHTEIWISKNGSKATPLTNNPKASSHSPQWSPDGKWIAFLSRRGDYNQIHVISVDGGESFPGVQVDADIYTFEWAPNGKQFAILMEEETTSAEKKINEKYGDFVVEDEKPKHSWLYSVDFNPEKGSPQENPLVALIDSVDFTINAFKWSPDGSKIVFDKQPNSLINTYGRSDIGVFEVAKKEWNVLVKNSGFDFLFDWSPDSKSIVYVSSLGNDSTTYFSNNHFFKIDSDGENNMKLAGNFDEELKDLTWTEYGIYALAYQKTKFQLFLISPTSGSIELVSETPDKIYSYSISTDASKIAFIGGTATSLKEIYTSSLPQYSPKVLTDFTDQIAQWSVGRSEVIQWKSKDGTLIEGVLDKPRDFDPTKKYPLLVVVHGGPTMADRPTPVPAFYPVVQWLNKGALVLRPNYRGSGGYGENFRSLDRDSLGIGYAWDVLSGVDYLDSLHMIDTSKMGCMGWSMGGYISAFLATTSDRFKAISVGAGYANTSTYYFTTDLHPFMLQYLKSTPWSNPAIYKMTSPITYINQASTPTLIQHGENDARIPIANAYELLQGLRDVGVPSKMVIYQGLGHTIAKPKARLAATWHNWQWFGEYLFGEDIEIPIE